MATAATACPCFRSLGGGNRDGEPRGAGLARARRDFRQRLPRGRPASSARDRTRRRISGRGRGRDDVRGGRADDEQMPRSLPRRALNSPRVQARVPPAPAGDPQHPRGANAPSPQNRDGRLTRSVARRPQAPPMIHRFGVALVAGRASRIHCRLPDRLPACSGPMGSRGHRGRGDVGRCSHNDMAHGGRRRDAQTRMEQPEVHAQTHPHQIRHLAALARAGEGEVGQLGKCLFLDALAQIEWEVPVPGETALDQRQPLQRKPDGPHSLGAIDAA